MFGILCAEIYDNFCIILLLVNEHTNRAMVCVYSYIGYFFFLQTKSPVRQEESNMSSLYMPNTIIRLCKAGCISTAKCCSRLCFYASTRPFTPKYQKNNIRNYQKIFLARLLKLNQLTVVNTLDLYQFENRNIAVRQHHLYFFVIYNLTYFLIQNKLQNES